VRGGAQERATFSVQQLGGFALVDSRFHGNERRDPLTHPRKSRLLPLVQRLVEVHERGADRGGGRAHGGKALAHRVHAADRGERALGGAGACERVGGLQRGGDELVERDPLRPTQTHVALDLAHRPVAQHRRKLFARGAPGRRGGRAFGAGISAPPIAPGGVLPRPPRSNVGRNEFNSCFHDHGEVRQVMRASTKVDGLIFALGLIFFWTHLDVERSHPIIKSDAEAL